MAGGPKTHVIGAGSLLGYLIAHNAVHPGAHRAVRELLSQSGDDVYTYIYEPAERHRLEQAKIRFAPDALFQEHLRQGVILLGAFVADPGTERVEDLKLVCNLFDVEQSTTGYFEQGRLRGELVYGFVGICAHWASLRDTARQVLDHALADAPLPPPPQTTPVPLVRASAPRRVLICGAGPRVPRVISQLAGYCGSVDVTLLTREADQVRIIEENLRTMVESATYASGNNPKPWQPEALPDGRRVQADFPWGRVNLRILVLDWTDVGRLLRFDLPETDVVLFLPREPSDVTDGLIAIDCLRIADAFVSKDPRFNPDLRVVALLGDPTKTDLLESRLDESAPENESRFTVLSSERLRQGFAVRNLFVRGLSQVMFELLSAHGQHLQRLLPAWPGGKPPEGSFEAWELARYLIIHDRLLPVGFELVGRSEPLLDASMLRPGQRIAYAELRAVYVVGRVPSVPEPSRS
jgi:hypothetical protein